MAKSPKYYVVWKGHEPGIYPSWPDCLAQVKAYPDAKYKAFPTRKEAEEAFHSEYAFTVRKKKEKTRSDWKHHLHPGSVAVDAACSGNPGDLEYQGVDPFSGQVLFRVGPLEQGTNNIGEFLAIVHALAMLKKQDRLKDAVYSDSRIAINWVKLKKPNTKLPFTSRNKPLQDLLERAIRWLENNRYSNPIKKWETEEWGENPADFGRK